MPANKCDTSEQLDIVKTEYELVQGQIDKYDEISSKIKTWAGTLWAASIGWSIQTRRKEVILVGIVLVMMFWLMDGMNKNYRQNYRHRRFRIIDALKTYFYSGKWPNDFYSPSVPFNEHEIFKATIKPHVALLYLALVSISLLVFAGI